MDGQEENKQGNETNGKEETEKVKGVKEGNKTDEEGKEKNRRENEGDSLCGRAH